MQFEKTWQYKTDEGNGGIDPQRFTVRTVIRA